MGTRLNKLLSAKCLAIARLFILISMSSYNAPTMQFNAPTIHLQCTYNRDCGTLAMKGAC